MNLLQLRTDLVGKSGRYDLVVDTTSYVDNGANFHLNAGQKYLDKLINVPENTAQIFDSLAIGEYSLTFDKHCRSIESVMVNSSTTRYELTKIDLRELKENYTDIVGDTDNGAPEFFALANLRALETTVKDDLGTFINLTNDEDDTDYTSRGIIIVPPVDEAYVVEITGKFSQLVLSSDTETNFWATEYPHLSLMAAMRSIEVFNRNTEGVKDWDYAIKTETFELGLDIAEEESFDVDQMEG